MTTADSRISSSGRTISRVSWADLMAVIDGRTSVVEC
jgi:hypothetical protein